MSFNKLGGIYYNETTEITKIDYGGSIPCFIGRTVNPEYLKTQTVEADSTANPPIEAVTYANLKSNAEAGRKINQLQKFTNFEQVNRSVANGGLGDYETEKDINPLLKFIHDFCEETKMMTEEYVACPYFYVVDLGVAENLSDWISAIETPKLKREIDYEVYIGWDTVKTETTNDNVTTKTITCPTIKDGNNDADFISFILAVNYDLQVNRATIGDFRKAFYSISKIDSTTKKYKDETYYKDSTNYLTIDNELLTLTELLATNNDTNISNNAIATVSPASNTLSKSRIYICEPLHFGKIVGRISITPYDMEPGYYAYNTLTVDDIILRRPSEQLALQLGGVIFNHLEETSSEEYIKINRTQSVSSRLINHPPDSLYQARNLVDYLVTKLFDVCYPQLKNKETETNIEYLQTQVNKVVNDSITDGDFIPPYTVGNERKGTFMSVQESVDDAYDIELVGMIQPVNCTYSIHIIAQINDAKVQIVSS